MVLLSILVHGIALMCFNVRAESTIHASVPVYGFEGAAQAVTSGHNLHYMVSLGKCKLIDGPDQPEFVETFGGRTVSYRTFNDREMPGTPFFVFHDQKLAESSNAGKLVRLTRTIKVFHNDTAEVMSQVYSADWSELTVMYTHECTLSTPDTEGNIEFQSTDSEISPVLSFEQIVESLENGRSIHIHAMVFLCPGGRESSFSNFGGHILDYEIKESDDNVGVLKCSLQSVVHHEPASSQHVLDVMHVRFHSNHTVEIVDTRARPPSLETIEEHVTYCPLSIGVPGGMVHVFASH